MLSIITIFFCVGSFVFAQSFLDFILMFALGGICAYLSTDPLSNKKTYYLVLKNNKGEIITKNTTSLIEVRKIKKRYSSYELILEYYTQKGNVPDFVYILITNQYYIICRNNGYIIQAFGDKYASIYIDAGLNNYGPAFYKKEALKVLNINPEDVLMQSEGKVTFIN